MREEIPILKRFAGSLLCLPFLVTLEIFQFLVYGQNTEVTFLLTFQTPVMKGSCWPRGLGTTGDSSACARTPSFLCSRHSLSPRMDRQAVVLCFTVLLLQTPFSWPWHPTRDCASFLTLPRQPFSG